MSEQPRKKPLKSEKTADESLGGWILVRLDQEDLLPTIIPYALAVAHGLNRQLRLIEILESDRASGLPADPVEWDLRRIEAQLHLSKLAHHYSDEHCVIDTRVLERFLPEETGGCDVVTAPILGFGRHNGELPWQLDAGNRRFLESHCNSILMVPDDLPAHQHIKIKRIMVTLDGSSHAERALPPALQIAKRHGAELYITHASPDVSLTQSAPLDSEALELMQRFKLRNQRVAVEYLSKIRARYSASGVSVFTQILDSGDVRRNLIELSRTKLIDLIVMASHGSSGHTDVIAGSVATFMLEHAPVPVLMVAREVDQSREQRDISTSTSGLRRPAAVVGYA